MRADAAAMQNDPEVAASVEGAARALWACSVSRMGRAAFLRAGGLEMVGGLLVGSRTALLVPIVGIIHQCITEVCDLYVCLLSECFIFILAILGISLWDPI